MEKIQDDMLIQQVKSKWILPLIILIAVLVITNGISVYFLLAESTVKEAPKKIGKSTDVSTIIPSPIISPPSNLSTFQKILASKCQDYLYSGVEHILGAKKDDLPISIDNTRVDIVTTNGNNIFKCIELYDKPYNSYVEIPISIYGYGFGEDRLSAPTTNLLLYDSKSQEGAHGGYPSIGVYGKVIKDDGIEKLAISLQIGEVPIVYPNDTPVIITAEKKLHLSSGEEAFVNMHVLLMHGDDPRLVDIISKYSQPRESNSDIEITDIDGAQNEIANTFFSNLSNLKSPEKEKITQIEKTLSAFSSK